MKKTFLNLFTWVNVFSKYPKWFKVFAWGTGPVATLDLICFLLPLSLSFWIEVFCTIYVVLFILTLIVESLKIWIGTLIRAKQR
ncbi:hypothetical protein EFS30_13525 [Levilactobacillus parabrevis]|nr:hypothetical protein [Levilactobacillus parabrevis]MCT4491597.1 hypothetical protein [Levilactobacillus parabrevis]